jgi:transaldolase
MGSTPLHELSDAGQSIWLDFIDRRLLQSGELARRIQDDALSGMTSNPTIFEKALAEGSAYDAQLAAAPAGLTAWQLFELVETEDVRDACDIFRSVYDDSGGADGYVSIEVSPGSAHDADATVEEAHRLREMVSRPNVMIKVPGTAEGARAFRRLIADGLNVNVTLLFAVEAYRSIIDAYMSGLEDRLARGEPIDQIASVASFFVSRVDSEIDKRLDARIAEAGSGGNAEQLSGLRGRAAIANARLAYALFLETTASDRWRALAARGARVQRPLWASTSTKNPAYRDVMYVEELIGPNTVNTLPPATLEAFRDHGVVRRTVDEDIDGARAFIAELEAVGISLDRVTDQLLIEGVASFSRSFDGLIAGLEEKSRTLGQELART